MANSFVNKASAGATAAATTIAVSPSAPAPANGNTAYITVTCVDTATTCTLKDNNGVTYTAIDTVDDSANGVIMFSFRSPTGGIAGSPTTFTATFNSSTTFRGILYQEWSGTDVSATPLDGHNMATKATTTTPTSNSITTTASGDAILAAVVADSGNSGTITAGTGYTLRNNQAATVNFGDESQVQGSAGAITASFTLGNNVTTIICINAFKAAAGAASLPPGQQSFDTQQKDFPSNFPVSLRHWAAPNRLILIGQDQLPPGNQLFQRQHDPKDSFANWRSYSYQRSPNLIGQDRLPPGSQTNYLPERATWRPESPPQNLANTLLSSAPPSLPPGQQLFNRPIDPQDSFSNWRSFAYQRSPNLIGQDQLPPGSQLFTRPLDPTDRFSAWRSWSWNLIPLLTALPPGRQLFDRLQQPPPALDFQRTVNVALLIGPALPPGKQLFTRSNDPADAFANWRFWASFNPNLTPPPPPPVKPPGQQLYSLPPLGPPPLVPHTALFNINLFPPPFIPPPPTFPATYYLLEDLYINDQYLPAGTIQKTADLGGSLPVNWEPNPNVDPVDDNAIAAYTAAGYRPRGLTRAQFSTVPMTGPNWVWQLRNGVYVLVQVANNPRVPISDPQG